MLFNTGEFFFFFLAVYLIYLPLSQSWQNRLLLLASYLFYAAWDIRFLSLIIISTSVDYAAALAIQYFQNRNRLTAARLCLLASILTNLSILGFFKYFNFFLDTFNLLLNSLGLPALGPAWEILLPVGISFYTFQSMSYTLDVYRGRQHPIRNWPDFALYVAFFPQLMAGPIERCAKLLPQLQSRRQIDVEDLRVGTWLIFWGVFKKVYIADNLSPYVEWAFALRGAESAPVIYLAIFAFSIQLYCDFSGYSDMARGLARLLGIHLSRNFSLPFWASNPAQVWQRWHITLSNWFRDYVYAPIRNALPSRSWHGLALIPTMTLIGFWHGAAWKYIVFGALWGVVLYLHRQIQPAITDFHRAYIPWPALTTGIGMILTFHLWLFLLIMFIAVDVKHGWQLWQYLLTDFSRPDYLFRDLTGVFFLTAPLIVMQAFQFAYGREDVLNLLRPVWRVIIYALMFSLLLAKGSVHRNEFIYFQF